MLEPGTASPKGVIAGKWLLELLLRDGATSSNLGFSTRYTHGTMARMMQSSLRMLISKPKLINCCLLLTALLVWSCSEGEIGPPVPPGVGSFICGDGTTIPSSKRCDNRPDCRDGSDEGTRCGSTKACDSGQFRCTNGTCLPGTALCNGRPECTGTGEDERNCNKTCTAGQFACTSDQTCHASMTWCDGRKDCAGNEDEVNCRPKTCDQSGKLSCSDGKCIDLTMVCNGPRDCTSGEDEAANCSSSGGRCGGVPTTGVCKTATTYDVCESGSVRTRTCDAGKTCQLTGGSAQCVAPPASCGTVPTTGVCKTETTYDICESGAVKMRTCDSGKKCQLVSGAASCVAPPPAACGTIPITGTCNSDNRGYQFCDGSAVQSRSCDTGMNCVMVSGAARCETSTTTTGCGSVTTAGVCAADTKSYQYCSGGTTLRTQTCAPGTTCKKDTSNNVRCESTEITPVGCGSITFNGECSTDKKTLKYCVDNSTIYTDNCISPKECKVDSAGFAMCTTPATSSGCGSVKFTGECFDSNRKIKWCTTENTIKEHTCESGSTCKWINDSTGYWCDYSSTPTTGCGSVPEVVGECQGNILKRCVSGTLYTNTCLTGYRCDYDWSTYQYDCIYDYSNACLGIPTEGQCAANTLQRCISGTLSEQYCTGDKTCGWNYDAGRYDCVSTTSDNCGTVTALGECIYDNSYWRRCVNGALVEQWCETGTHCDYDYETSQATCVFDASACGDVPPEGRCSGSYVEWCVNDMVSYDYCDTDEYCAWDYYLARYSCIMDEQT